LIFYNAQKAKTFKIFLHAKKSEKSRKLSRFLKKLKLIFEKYLKKVLEIA